MTTTVSQSGIRATRPSPGSVSMTNMVASSSLSAIGSSHAPSVVVPVRRAIRPSSASVMPATAKTTSAQPGRP